MPTSIGPGIYDPSVQDAKISVPPAARYELAHDLAAAEGLLVGNSSGAALDAVEQLRVQKDAESRGLEIIGFAHSHPDHPPIPSRFDADHAWNFYSYLVDSVQKGALREARSWRLDDAKTFQEERLVVAEV